MDSESRLANVKLMEANFKIKSYRLERQNFTTCNNVLLLHSAISWHNDEMQ